MSVNRIIVAGAGVMDAKEHAGNHLEIMRAESCGDVERLLNRN